MSLLIEEAKKLYESWKWEELADELESPYDRGAFLSIVGSYQDLIKEIERLQCYEIDFHKAMQENIRLTKDYEFTIIGLKNQVDELKEKLRKHE